MVTTRDVNEHLAVLRGAFENLTHSQKTLVKRAHSEVYLKSSRPAEGWFQDQRGPVVASNGMVRTFLKPEQIDQLVVMYLQGGEVKTISAHFGIHESTVRNHLRRQTVPLRTRGLDVYSQIEAAKLYRLGLTFKAVGERLGVSERTARRAVIDSGTPVRPRGRQAKTPSDPEVRDPLAQVRGGEVKRAA